MIDQFGVVSEEVALEMARDTLTLTNAEVIISTTGEAGPSVNEQGIVIGTICFGLIIKNEEFTYREVFSGSRLEIINSAVSYILSKLLMKLI